MWVMEMCSKKQQIPAIRFNGFTDAWEQRKIGEFYFFKNGLNKEKQYFGKGTPIVNFTDVFHNRGLNYENLTGKVTLTQKEIENYEVKKGDLFFTRTSETIEEIGKPSVMLDDSKNTVFSGFVLRGRALDADPLVNEFKKYVFFTEKFRDEMIKKSSMTTRALTSGTALREMYFTFPENKEEQKKIGDFLTRIDRTIALHQRQLDNYKALKKAILQKIFNQELRFKDENGNEYPKWMRKTVNDIGDVVTGTTPSTKEKAYYNNGIYSWVTPTDIVQKNIDSTPRKLTEQGLSKGRMLPENTILVTCIASIGKNAILKQKGSCNQQINAIVCNKNHNYEFVFYLMEKNTDVLKSLAGKGTMDIVNKDVFSKMKVTVPCLEEQLRIGEFLSELDGKIEDEHKIVNLMKKQKQGLMQRMFV